MVAVPGGGAKAAWEALKAGGVLVRYFDTDRMREKLRISIGTPAEDDALLAAIDAAGIGRQP